MAFQTLRRTMMLFISLVSALTCASLALKIPITFPEPVLLLLQNFFSNFAAVKCELGDICAPDQTRPTLGDGRPSHGIWDRARHNMKTSFAEIEAGIPGAKVSYIWGEPLVVYFDNVLSDEEIDYIVEAANPVFKKSGVVAPDGTTKEDPTRTSDTAFLFTNMHPKLQPTIERIAFLAGFNANSTEHMSVNRYEASQFFNPHYDFLQEAQLERQVGLLQCQRASTALIYLSDVEEGGETMFTRNGDMDGSFKYDVNNPDHLKISPKRGRVLIWYDMHPFTEQVDYRTLHGGSPVVKGTKIAATLFSRNCTQAYAEPNADEYIKADL